MTKQKVKTFKELYDIISPDEPISEWLAGEKRWAVHISKKPESTVDDIIEAMGCVASDWSDTEKAIIAEKLGKAQQ